MAKERWASRLGLVLAMAGNAVGLGNFLRFPAQAAQNGGGAFLIPYLVALLVLGLPLMWVEWAMGRYGGQHGHHSAPGIFQSFSKNPIWKYLGVFGLWSCLIIAAFYLYIESWTMAYAGYSAINGFKGMDTNDVGQFFANLTGEKSNHIVAIGPLGMVLFFACIVINTGILSLGLAKGIELVAKVGMPLLILFAAILAVRGLMIDPVSDPHAKTSALEGLNFVWEPTTQSLADPKVWLAAAGQIFFTLSIGMGSIHCYASYLRKEDDVALTGATAAWTNEFCEVILGGAILIPIAVAYLGLQDVQNITAGGSGFGLGFFVFPTLFNNWGALAPVAGFMWFGLLFFAAITSSLAMGQPIMAFLQEEFGMNRPKSALAFGLLVLMLALPVAMLHSNSFFDEFDFWAGTVMLVVFALVETILFCWVFGMNNAWGEMTSGAEMRIPRAFFFILKYITPVFLTIILVAYVFRPEADWSTYVKSWFGGDPAPAWKWSGDGMIGKLLHKDVEEKIHSQESVQEFQDLAANLRSLAPFPLAGLGKVGADLGKSQLLEQSRVRVAFLEKLKIVRNIDRLVMVAVFAFFCVLVRIAWKKRRREGRA